MKSIALIHTVKSVANTFEKQLRHGLGREIKVYNLLDEYLAKHPNEVGEFTVINRNRLYMDIKVQEMTGADMIVTTCSTLTPAVEMIRPFIEVPLIAIDDAMGRKGVTLGSKVLILATAGSTLEPTRRKLLAEADKAGVSLEVEQTELPDAFAAMQLQNMKEHDEILKNYAKEIHGFDCVILAQASMAHMEEEICLICGCPVLSSPKLCIEEVNGVLNSLDNEAHNNTEK